MFYIIYLPHGIHVYIRGLIHLVSMHLLILLSWPSSDDPYVLAKPVRIMALYMVEYIYHHPGVIVRYELLYQT